MPSTSKNTDSTSPHEETDAPLFGTEPTKGPGVIARILRKNRSLKRDKKNPYANERLKLQKIRQDIDHIHLRISHLHRMQERLKSRDLEPAFSGDAACVNENRTNVTEAKHGKPVRQN